MNRHHSVSVAAIAVFLYFLASETAAQTADSDNIAKVKKAWASRQASIKSARFLINRRMTYTKASQVGPRTKPGIDTPAQDTTLEKRTVIAFDGDKLRYEYDDRQVTGETGRNVDYTYTATWSGAACKVLLSNNGKGFPQGTVRSEKQHVDLTNYQIFPIIAHYRALNPLLPLSQGTLSEQGTCLVEGRQCLVLGFGNPAKGVTRTVCVDPTMDYAIVRLTITADLKAHFHVDLRYQQDARLGWVPSAWDSVDSSRGSPIFCTAEVKEYSLNKPMPPEYFDIEFPPGTWVVDQRYPPPGRSHLVKPSGEERPSRSPS